MRHSHASRPPVDIYPVDSWSLIEEGFHPEDLPQTETLFALANGYIGVRGALAEGPRRGPATFINGFHDTWPIAHGEDAYGLTREGQTIVGLPDAHLMVVHVDNEPLDLGRGRVLSHRRALDFRSGVLERAFEWESPAGLRVRIETRRLVSFEHRHLLAFQLELTVLEGEAALAVVSPLATCRPAAAVIDDAIVLDPRRAAKRGLELEPVESRANGTRLRQVHSTRNSGLELACGAEHVVEASVPVALDGGAEPDEARLVLTAGVVPGARIVVSKFAAYHPGRAGQVHDLVARVERSLDEALGVGFDGLREGQRKHLDEFWERADVRIEGDDAMQQAVRWNLFQIAQATLRTDGEGVPAKGLTGQGYDGHYFWDTEIYVLPFLIYTFPDIARRLLQFRHRMLPQARRQASIVSERGALFPWRTINGREASAYFQAGTAQYHINADIAHALRKYVEVTGDREALREFGAEILVETARLWESLGFHAPGGGAFHLHGVTGPDEYTALVDDNAYTNLMAQQNLGYAADVLERLAVQDPGSFRDLAGRLSLSPDEPAAWRRAAEAMLVPFDAGLGIHAQDAHFLEKEVWDFDGTPADHYPLLLHYHPLVIYRFQVLKQADVVLAMFLLPGLFPEEQRRANFAYYEPLTTGDSSLSHAIQSIMAAEAGQHELALQHFGHALFMDLGNWAGNVEDGVHIASSAGVWLALIHGFAGMRHDGGELALSPRLPRGWQSLEFALRLHDGVLHVRVLPDAVALRAESPEMMTVELRGRRIRLPPSEETRVAL